MKKLLAMVLAAGTLLNVEAWTWTDPDTNYNWEYSRGGDTDEIVIQGVTPEPKGSLAIPTTINDYLVTSIGEWAFGYCGSLTSVTIPDSVTSIGEYAFNGCSSLISFTIPNSVTNIGEGAFYACWELTSITIPRSVTSIGDEAFGWCSSLTSSITIPDSVTSIGDGVFCACSSLTSITIPDSVTSIGEYAFNGCSSLISFTIPNSVTNIGEGAFWGCDSLMSVTIPDIVTNIGPGTFYGCWGLTSIMIPNGVTNIGSRAFGDCRGLTSITIPSSVANIGEEAFCDCRKLVKAKVPRVLKSQIEDGYVFWDCASNLSIQYYVDGEELKYDFIVGIKSEVDVDLVGYTAKGLPGGLSYTAKTGKVTGAAKTAGEYEATFSKNGEDDVAVLFSVRDEKVSVGCAGLSGGTFTAGVAGSAGGIPLEIESETGVKSVAVAKLPNGMKYDSKTGLIIGAPTKSGVYTVVLTVTTKSGVKRTASINVSVAALPDSAVGTFNGFVKTEDGEENMGTFQLTTTDAGKLSAKVVTATGSYSFGGTCWDSAEDGIYAVTLTTKKGETLTLSLDSSAGWDHNQLTGSFAVASGTVSDVVARRNAFGKTWLFIAEGNMHNGWTLSYAANAKAANLTVTLNADGSTKIAGKLETLSVNASGYSDVTGLAKGVILADFAPVVSVKEGKSNIKKTLSIRTCLWFDRSNDHIEDIGSAKLIDGN